MIQPLVLIFVLVLIWSAPSKAATDPNPLLRLKYQNPGLRVDLGVGLWAEPLPMDFDGDGFLDLVVNCPDVPFNGAYFFRNPGMDTALHPSPVFQPGKRISAGHFNAAVSYGENEVTVMTPGKKYPHFTQDGFSKGVSLGLPANIHPRRVRGNFWHSADYDGDGVSDLVVGVDDWTEYGWDNAYDSTGRWIRGPLRGWVYWLKNTGTTEAPVYDPPRQILANGKPLETFGWPSPCMADFKRSGKLDMLCGEFLDGFTFFENKGTRENPVYSEGIKLHDTEGSPIRMDLQMIRPVVIDWNRDGYPDLVVGDEDGRVALLLNKGKVYSDGSPAFDSPRYFQQEADFVKGGALVTPVGYDWDGDGAQDILCGNSAGYILFFRNLSPPGVEFPKWAAPVRLEANGEVLRILAGQNGSIQGPAEAKWGYTTLSVADWDGDGLADLIVNSIWGKVVWYRNVGTRSKPSLAAAQPIEVEWEGEPPRLSYGWLRPEGKALLTQWRTTPVVCDWNGDGLPDLVMLDPTGTLSLFERAQHNGKRVLLPPKHVFCDEKGAPLRLAKGSGGASGRRKLCIVDWDGDGKLDILLDSTNANFLRQVDCRDGKWFFKDLGPVSSQKLTGHDVSPTVVDWNQDGIPDFLCGAEDGHLYYLKNPRGR